MHIFGSVQMDIYCRHCAWPWLIGTGINHSFLKHFTVRWRQRLKHKEFWWNMADTKTHTCGVGWGGVGVLRVPGARVYDVMHGDYSMVLQRGL